MKFAQTEQCVDMFPKGIVSATRAARVVLKDAASAAGSMITTEASTNSNAAPTLRAT